MLPYDHFHSNTHEVLGLSRGRVILRIGGMVAGKLVEAVAGDVLILPAGIAHAAVSDHSDYEMIGGYPGGISWDLMTGTLEEREIASKNIEMVHLPLTDPVFGPDGGLTKLWYK